MKYKILYVAIMAAFVGLTFTSCGDFLDELPDNRTELKTEQSVSKILVSAYPKSTNSHISEFYSDNIDENTSLKSYFFILEKHLYHWQQTTEEDQDSPHALWTDCYSAITSANQALKAVEEMGNPASLQPQRGEALLCRAYGHFLLATTFCRAYSTQAGQDLGIPYISEVETTVAPQHSRETLEETYSKIAADIEEGIPLLSDDAYKVARYHFNRKAAFAFAARFYLYYMQPDFSNCEKVIDYATRVVSNNPSGYLRDWQALGDLTPNGDVQPNAFADATNSANLLIISATSWWPYVGDPGFSPGQKYCANNITALEGCKSVGPWGNQNVFRQTPFAPGGSIKTGFRRLALYEEFSADHSSYTGHMLLPAFTTDETLLCRAEAYTLLKRYDEAANDVDTWQKAFTKNQKTLTKESINAFYAALPYYEPDAPTVKKSLHPDFALEEGMQENMIHCILHARRILTLEEGLRWQDVKRYGIVIYRRYFEGQRLIAITDKMETNDPRRAVQIPASVISSGMQPNPRND